MAYDGSIRIDTSINGDGFSKGMQKLSAVGKTALTGLATGIGVASAAMGAGAIAGAKYNAQMEQYITSFTTMLGSADKAQGMISDIKKFAAETPFELPDLAKGAQTLLAFGTAEEKIMPTMKMIGDISQGNKEKFDSLTLAFAQIGSTGKLTGQDLLQCINAGFNPLNEISKTTGKSVAVLKEEMSKGAISADMVAEAFQHATSKGGQFYNAMQAQSQTFNGQLSTLKDNAMSFLGELTEGFTDTLKDSALPMVNSWLSELQAAYKAGGPAALTRAFGDVLAESVTAVAKEAPGVIESGSKVLQSFIWGIRSNLPELGTAAFDIVTELVSGVADIFPAKISQPIKKGLDDVKQSFQSGGLKDGIQTFGRLMDAAGDVVGDVAKTVLPVFTKALDFTGKNLKYIAPLAVAATTAITGFKVANHASKWMGTASKALDIMAASTVKSAAATTANTASVTLGQLAYGVFTGKATLAAAAQTLFNTALNATPIGLAITAVVGLTAAVATFTLMQKEENAETQKAIEGANASISATQRRTEAFGNLKVAQAECAASDLAQMNHLSALSTELLGLSDATGRVAEQDRARAEFILSELNTALGTEYQLTGDQISNYQTLQSEIAKTIEAKRAQIMLAAQEDLYTEAINNRATAEKAASDAQIAISQTEQQIADLKRTHAEEYAVLMEAEAAGITGIAEVYDDVTEQKALALQAQLQDLQSTLNLQQEAYAKSDTEIDGYYSAIAGYENASALILSGNVDEAIAALERQNTGFENAASTVSNTTEAQKQAVGQQYAESIIALDRFSDKYKQGTEGYTKEQLESLKKNTSECAAEAKNSGIQIVNGTIIGLNGKKIDLTKSITNLKNSGIDVLSFSIPEWVGLGEDCGQGYVNGILSKVEAARAAGAALANASSQSGIRKTQKSNSPAKVTQELGHDFGDGYVLGILDRIKAVSDAGKSLSQAAIADFTAKMRAAVEGQQAIAGARIAAVTQYTAAKAQPLPASSAPTQTTNLYQTINTHDSLSPAELTREAEDFLERRHWKNP